MLTLPVLGGLLAYTLAGIEVPDASVPATVALDVPDVARVASPEPPSEALATPETTSDKIDLVVRRHDTLERIFRQLNLNLDDLTAILSLPRVRRSLYRIKPGETVTLIHDAGVLQELNHRISETELLSVRRGDDGFAAEVIATPIETRVVYARGTIETSLFVAARAAGIRPDTIMRLANDIFGWDIDFALDIRSGDHFTMIYEQKYRDGQYLGDGRILAAEFFNDGDTYRAVRYASEDGKIDDYYTPEGRSVRRQFLRAPLDFTRVSSNFNPRRRHPILNTIRAHQGVDYAAPTGTLIKASGDGRVSFIGVKGGYGRAVILEHGGGISTLYGHMSRFARGLRDGRRVKQGDTIGYVGSSGAATGPHLHYEYRIDGIHKNPRTVRLPDAAPLPANYMADFQVKSGVLLANLERAHETALAAAAN